jgi:hypothetical protein
MTEDRRERPKPGIVYPICIYLRLSQISSRSVYHDCTNEYITYAKFPLFIEKTAKEYTSAAACRWAVPPLRLPVFTGSHENFSGKC